MVLVRSVNWVTEATFISETYLTTVLFHYILFTAVKR